MPLSEDAVGTGASAGVDGCSTDSVDKLEIAKTASFRLARGQRGQPRAVDASPGEKFA
jgi:hypothetical protein